MRITVEIEESVLDDLVKFTGERKKSPAVAKAVGAYVRQKKMTEFGDKMVRGEYDYPLTNDEVERFGL